MVKGSCAGMCAEEQYRARCWMVRALVTEVRSTLSGVSRSRMCVVPDPGPGPWVDL